MAYLLKILLKTFLISTFLLTNNLSAKISKKHIKQAVPNKIEQTTDSELEPIVKQTPEIPEKLTLLKKAYPDVIFEHTFIEEAADWKITIKVPDETQNTQFRTGDFIWCDGSLLPESELQNKEKYWSLFYTYPKELKDPSAMTEEERAALKELSSRSNRRNGAGTPMFFFDLLYDASTRNNMEKHIVQVTFLDHKTSIHSRLKKPLENIDAKVKELAKTDAEVADFLKKIKSNDAYNWRLIDGTNRKSFHSYGIAVDIIPVRITGEIYWSWARDKNPSGWMLIPLKRRWLPPMKVVEIFEEEGFIWGGKWAIWDNMHFEYHPELILFNK